MDPATGLAVASLVSQGASMLGGIGGYKNAKSGARAQRRAIRREGAARMRDLYKESTAVIGEQRSRYAAAGVGADTGTALLAQRETQNEFARQQGLTAYLTKQKEKGAQSQFNAQRTALAAGFSSDLSQMSQMAYSFYTNRPTGP